MVKVAKFGGSSLSCAAGFENVKEIIRSDADRKIIVVSALGKRHSSDAKITDLLINVCFCAKNGTNYKPFLIFCFVFWMCNAIFFL